MEKESNRKLAAAQRGSALVVVLLMLLLVLPLSLIIGRLVMQWQGGAARLLRLTAMEYAARAGFEDALARLAANRIALDADEATEFEVQGLEGLTPRVRVSRQPDAVVSLEGRVLGAIEAARADLSQVGLDPDMRRVRQFRKIEVCLVEVTVTGSGGGVRLWGVLLRASDGTWQRAGLRVDRGFF